MKKIVKCYVENVIEENQGNKVDNIIVYSDGELELKVSLNDETIWLNQNQLAELFKIEAYTITYHIKNIYKQNELDKIPTTRKIRVVQKEGNREVQKDIEHYNLDMIISIGYRVNSITATKFRQWATTVLKNYIKNGYAINEHKLSEQRLKLRGKVAPSADDKKLLKAKLKEIILKRDNEIKELVKEKFDYEIPISDIKKAGIIITGAKGDNQLPELLEIFTKHRKEKKLWS